MNSDNKTILEKANAAVSAGDNEGYLAYCTEDTYWNFMGDEILDGKDAVRAYMKRTYIEPPKFTVETMIAEGDFVTVLGRISLKNNEGALIDYAYCDVWRFRDGKMAELKAYVITV